MLGGPGDQTEHVGPSRRAMVSCSLICMCGGGEPAGAQGHPYLLTMMAGPSEHTDSTRTVDGSSLLCMWTRLRLSLTLLLLGGGMHVDETAGLSLTLLLVAWWHAGRLRQVPRCCWTSRSGSRGSSNR